MKATELKFDKLEEGLYKLSRECSEASSPNCMKVIAAEVTSKQLDDLHRGAFVQAAFPDLSAAEREALFITGICGECWEFLFADDEDEDEEN